MTFEHSYIFINFEQCQWDTSSILATQQQGIQSFFSLRQKIWISTQGYKWGGPHGVLCVDPEGQPVEAPHRSSAPLTVGRPAFPAFAPPIPPEALREGLWAWFHETTPLEIFLGVGVSGDFKMASPALKHSLWYLLEVLWWCRLPDISSVTFPSSERNDYSLCCQGHLFPFGLLNEVFAKTGCSSKCFLFLFALLSSGWLSYVVGEMAKVLGLL